MSAGDQSGRVGDKIPGVLEILTTSSLVLFLLSSLSRTATWRSEAKRGCSFSVEPGCKLPQPLLTNQLLAPWPTSAKGWGRPRGRGRALHTSAPRQEQPSARWTILQLDGLKVETEKKCLALGAQDSLDPSSLLILLWVAGMLEVPVTEKGRGLRL